MVTMIKIKNLKKSFRNISVLRGINLKISEGETTVIIGQSGCGKTILLKLLIGIIKPDEGKVIVDNKDVTKLSYKELNQLRLKFGMVFQSSALFDSLNVRENVGFSLIEHTKMSEEEIDKRIRECLQMVGLYGVEEKMPAELSGGMKKRVALARAISMNPEIILYDEPTVGIDPIMADSIDKLIKKLHDKLGITSVVVTHDMNSAYYVGDKIAMLHKGKIVAQASPSEIKRSDKEVVRKFVNGDSGKSISVNP